MIGLQAFIPTSSNLQQCHFSPGEARMAGTCWGMFVMRWPALVLVSLALAFPKLAIAQAPAISPTMRGPTSYVQLQIVSGRLNLVPKQSLRTRTSSSSSGNDRKERMAVDLTGVNPAVDYELVTSQSQLLIQARNLSYFRIARELKGGQSVVPFEFRQHESGDIVFTWGAGEAKQERRFKTVWHMLLVEPEAAKAHILPILEFFRPGWNLAVSIDRITDALYANADDRVAVPRERWGHLVAQLKDGRYAYRQAADRQLRGEGKAVLSYLEGLPDEDLDFEQRHRIRGIRRWLTRGDDNDAPESIAAWLSSDRRVWLALLNQPDLQRRELAAKHLSRLLGEPIAFDAAASKDARQEQIEALRQKLPSPAGAREAKVDR